MIDDRLPFSIGLPSLLAMRATLSFQHRNLSVLIHHDIYWSQLEQQSSRLTLVLVRKINYQRAFVRKTQYSKPDHNGQSRFQCFRESQYFKPDWADTGGYTKDRFKKRAVTLFSFLYSILSEWKMRYAKTPSAHCIHSAENDACYNIYSYFTLSVSGSLPIAASTAENLDFRQ